MLEKGYDVFDAIHLKKDKTIIYNEIHSSKIDFNGQTAIMCICRNMNDRMQSELTINQQNNELKKLNADKDRFITILAHDLKNPFNSIIGFLNLLISNINDYDKTEIENYINIINDSAQKTYNLLEDILIWVKAQSGKFPYNPQKQNLTCICNEAIENLNLAANNKRININNHITEEISIYADKNMLTTILRNLISNAIKFTNSNGKIDITAEQYGSIVTILVSDNGVGIDSETIKKLFDITQKTSTEGTANESGTGLGLLLCKEFIDKHCGKIWVESELGKGSNFKFTMPLYTA